MIRSTASRIQRFVRDRRAVAAVEFAIILPVMALLYLGTFEAANAILAKRKVDGAVEAVGSIVGRSTAMDATRMRNAMLVSEGIMGTGKAPVITVTTVRTDAEGRGKIHWQRIGTQAGAAEGTPYPLPGDLAGLTHAYFVFAKLTYTHTPVFDLGGLFGTMEFERDLVYRPRTGAEIDWK